jgi:uncharacterized protein (TIGR00730 family)
LQRLCVYCGSSDKLASDYLDAAARMGSLIAAEGIDIIYGGGGTGMMGALASSALAAGGRVIGVIPELFNTTELVHPGLVELHVVKSMHARKAMMAEMADAFIALPGGFGTFEELFEMLTWMQIGLHDKPIGILNVMGYFEPLIQLIDHAQKHGFIYEEHRELVVISKQPEGLISSLRSFKIPANMDRWVNRKEA